jgi:O-antigen/teichoic acid export membrane protein
MLKATSAVAGAKIATILVSLMRMKAIAFILGPSGMGLVNLVSSSIEFTRVVTNLGIDSAVVRSIAEAHAKHDRQRLAIIYHVAVRTSLFIGAIGWLAISIASPWLSHAATGSTDRAWLFVLGGASLLFSPLLGVQLGLLQGLRQIGTLAKCQLITSPVAACLTVLLISVHGVEGGIAALAITSISSLGIHCWFVRNWRPTEPLPRNVHYKEIIWGNLRDGSGFAINGLWLTASSWINLLLIRHYYGEQGTLHVGMYSAAAMLANFYVSIIISALATEFYPSLTAEAADPQKMRSMLNRQAVLALDAGVLATLVLIVAAPIALLVLYSSEFTAAADLMRLLLCGTAIRFSAFPLGFAILALGHTRLFALCEVAMGVVTITLSCIGVTFYGLMGLGVAFITANFLQAAGLWLLTRRLNMSWDSVTNIAVIGAGVALALVVAISFSSTSIYGIIAAFAVVAIYGVVAAKRIQSNTGITFTSIIHKISRRKSN